MSYLLSILQRSIVGLSLVFSSLSTCNADELSQEDKNELMQSVVLIEGKNSSGTGFLVQSPKGLYIYTAAHVLSGNTAIKCTLPSGQQLRNFSSVQIATDVDVARIVIRDRVKTAMKRWDMSQPKVGMDHPIYAFGNSGGGGVATVSSGEVNGVGNKSYEVSASIIQGNSGGPIIDAKSGVVVGIATHLIAARKDIWAADTRYGKVRRFAARLDRPLRWNTTSLAAFGREMAVIEKFDKTTKLLFALAQLEPYQNGLRLNTKMEGGLDAMEVLQANSSSSAVKGLIAMNQNLAGRRNVLRDHTLMKKYLAYYKTIYQSAASQNRNFKSMQFTNFHQPEAKLSLEYRENARKSLEVRFDCFKNSRTR
jgi:hypothetical protein